MYTQYSVSAASGVDGVNVTRSPVASIDTPPCNTCWAPVPGSYAYTSTFPLPTLTASAALLKPTSTSAFNGTDPLPLTGDTLNTFSWVLSTTAAVWKLKLPGLSIVSPARSAMPVPIDTEYVAFACKPDAGVMVTC